MNSRDFESLVKKRINAKWSIIFNRACLKENITPKYVQKYIYIYIYTTPEGIKTYCHRQHRLT